MKATRAEAPSYPHPVRLSPEEWALALEAARVNQQTFSEFVRDALLAAAWECLEVDDVLRSARRVVSSRCVRHSDDDRTG